MFPAEVQTKIDARPEERLHIIRHGSDCGAVGERKRTLFVGATKDMSCWSLRPNTKTLAKEFPDTRKDTLGSRYLEVVDVDDKKDSKIGIEKARRPLWDLDETTFETMSITVLLPVRT